MSQPVERESMEVDVLFVGAGPATLAGALHLMRSIEAHNARNGGSRIEPPTVLVIEKSAEVGDHMLSGAVIKPNAIQELMPDFVEQGFPTEYVCDNDMTYVFTPKRAIRLPINMPMFKKRGYHVASLNKVAKWLAEKCEEAGRRDLLRLRRRQAADRGRSRGRRAHRRHGRRQAREAEGRTSSPAWTSARR